ncbi:amidohydrolase family protein [Gordonia sp. TBRC 11910]|uniref:Amidohydrolase family protein n=1 Tax=Gordonia asplenii TaxID=2725283 RepID=A0A848KVT4_9ACTN|nr:amidohydrolase family protein [Gordonia asplenii]NMO02680.1 amidohydrolase family protein [Gordonia asplenii]
MSTFADLILRAKTIHQMSPDAAPATMVAVSDGVIVAVGDDADARDLTGASTRVVDLGDATLTPGLIDGHFHPLHGLSMTAGTDLTSVRSLPELIAALRESPRDAGWVKAWGLDVNAYGGRPVTNEPLIEALGSDVPVWVIMSDAHSAIASPAALAAAGISGPREFTGNAEIVCDADGLPTGHILEFEALSVMDPALPPESVDSRRRRLVKLLSDMAATGLTAGNAMDYNGGVEVMPGFDDHYELPMRVRFAPWCMPGVDADGLAEIVALQQQGGRRWQVDGVKFFMDGTIEGGTAWMEAADSHGECLAPNWPDPQAYRAAVHHLASNGVPTVTHAIGDAAVRHALSTLAGASKVVARHRIEHIEAVPLELVGGFVEHGVVASMQPTHCTHFSRADQSDAWSQRLGPQRSRRAFATRDLREAGALVALGSDWPVAPYDPRPILADAQLRRRAGHPEEDPICPEQALTAQMALEGYTTHSAVAQGNADVAGRIAPGFRADFTAFSVDPLVAAPDELAQAPIAATLVGGEFTHVGDGVG